MIAWERLSLDDHRLDAASQQIHRGTGTGGAAAENNYRVFFLGHPRGKLSFLRVGDSEDAFSGHFRQEHSALSDVGATRSRPRPTRATKSVESSGSLNGFCLPSSVIALVSSISSNPFTIRPA